MLISSRMMIEGYNQFGATERVAGAIRNILDFHGVVAPHNGEPYSEALLMGIGGGLGAEYATWAFTGIDPSRPRKSRLYLRFHHVKNYIEKKEDTALQKIAARIGASLTVKETASREVADHFLRKSLQAGKPVIAQLSVWQGLYSRHEVNEAYSQNPAFFPPLLFDEYILFLPYYLLPYPWISGYLATIYGIDEDKDQVFLTDFSNQPHAISNQQLIASRSVVKGWKNVAYTLDPPQTKPDLAKAVRLGIQDCTESLLHDMAVISGAHLRVKAWQAMATNIGDFRGKRGWSSIFNEPWQLFDTLTRLHAQIAFFNSDGGALRSSYADFLEIVSTILKKPDLKEIAHQFADIGILWDEIGTASLHDDIPELQAARQVALEWHTTFKVYGSSATKQLNDISMKLQKIRSEFIEERSFSEQELFVLLEELSARFHEVYDAEKSALLALRSAMK